MNSDFLSLFSGPEASASAADTLRSALDVVVRTPIREGALDSDCDCDCDFGAVADLIHILQTVGSDDEASPEESDEPDESGESSEPDECGEPGEAHEREPPREPHARLVRDGTHGRRTGGAPSEAAALDGGVP